MRFNRDGRVGVAARGYFEAALGEIPVRKRRVPGEFALALQQPMDHIALCSETLDHPGPYREALGGPEPRSEASDYQRPVVKPMAGWRPAVKPRTIGNPAGAAGGEEMVGLDWLLLVGPVHEGQIAAAARGYFEAPAGGLRSGKRRVRAKVAPDGSSPGRVT